MGFRHESVGGFEDPLPFRYGTPCQAGLVERFQLGVPWPTTPPLGTTFHGVFHRKTACAPPSSCCIDTRPRLGNLENRQNVAGLGPQFVTGFLF